MLKKLDIVSSAYKSWNDRLHYNMMTSPSWVLCEDNTQVAAGFPLQRADKVEL